VFLLVKDDKVGRKYIMMGGMLLAILLYRPIYKQMYETTSVKNKTEMVETLAELKENKKQTMDSIYTTNKGYRWNNFSRSKVSLENGTAKVVVNLNRN
jgi:hypothetical protein